MECSGVNVSQILSNHSIVTVKKEEKQLKPWGRGGGGKCSWTNKITRHFPIGLEIFKSSNDKRKSSPAFANLWLLLVIITISLIFIGTSF